MPDFVHPPPPPPEERHPLSQKLRAIALSLPETREDHPWGDVVFKIGDKMFMSCAVHSGGITVKANPGELDALLERENIKLAAYVGRFGWISMTLESEADLPFAEQLIRTSYELISARLKGKRKPKSA